ncbi:Os06g0654600 [Oryza sativa Japonica Group]|uniref:Os06g0654600 protein n=1 Tax=Oryza sativa subsp. japonica TaxID=39947 RepID=A0A0P0WZH7_ORYSJ|nr:Os06g0654600 [Oryza sativa Japonica Group]
MSSNTWRIFSYKELHAATNGFSEENKLGEGGFGSVYWGKTSDGLQIAVKKLKATNTSKAEMEFAVEVEVLARVRHKNLLGLRGYCAGGAAGDQRMIVYDYMPNLSLLSHLHGQFAADVRLDWARRMAVAVGAAEGLVHLHHEATPHIIHRDIKASNVLLDSGFAPLVADFGFAKLVPEGVSHMTTRQGHPGVPRAGVRHVGEGLRRLRRLQLRHPPPRARLRQEAHRAPPLGGQAHRHRVGGAAHRPRPPRGPRRPAPPRRVRRRAARPRRRGRRALRPGRARAPPRHARRRPHPPRRRRRQAGEDEEHQVRGSPHGDGQEQRVLRRGRRRRRRGRHGRRGGGGVLADGGQEQRELRGVRRHAGADHARSLRQEVWRRRWYQDLIWPCSHLCFFFLLNIL